jgi:hypothetical protein
MNDQDNYKCEKCGHTLLKSNKFLHDLKCESSQRINPTNYNNNMYINNQNDFDDEDNLFFMDTYKCEICNAKMKLKDKADHLLCHELEQDEKNITNDRVRNNSNMNINSNQPNIHFNINDFNLRPNFDIDVDSEREYNRSNNRRINRRRFNSRNSFDSDDDDDDDFGSLDDGFDENEPLDDDIIQTFQITKINDINKLSEDKKRCSICLENYKNGDDSIILPCIHIFHSECIKKWMKRNGICPICKFKINSKNNDNPY